MLTAVRSRGRVEIKNVTAFGLTRQSVVEWASEPYWADEHLLRRSTRHRGRQYWDALPHLNYLDQADYGDGDAPADPRKLIENSLALMYMKPATAKTPFLKFVWAANTYDMVIVEMEGIHNPTTVRSVPLENR